MNATLLEPLGETPRPSASCTNCPAVLRLERALEQLQRDFRREVGYWKNQHAKAVKRIEQLEEELDQSRGQVHALQDKLFGRKSEKSAQGHRSNDLFDPQEVGTTPKKRGAQHGHAGHGRRDYSHLPVAEEFVALPEESLIWAHVRRDFVGVGKSWTELTPWALEWLRRIRHIYHVNRERLQHPFDSVKFQEQDVLLRRAVEAMRAEAVTELSNPKLRQPCRKVLESLQEHWLGLVRFVDDPRIPMDNNASERAARGPAVARKNFYGSGSLWSGRLAATMFSLLATLAHWQINPRLWLTWYFESCAAASGKSPDDIRQFLPWNLSPERRMALAEQVASPSTADTS
jgi:hypothetical protein